MVWRMFSQDFRCANDVADILADICCYQQKHLPTGSTLSGRVAFFSAKAMFDELSDLATESDSQLTVYVDDITTSGPNVTKQLISKFRQVIRRHGLTSKSKKTKTFPASAPKTVTGVIVSGDEVRLPNSRHKKIWQTRCAIRNAEKNERKNLICSLNGRLQEAKQIHLLHSDE